MKLKSGTWLVLLILPIILLVGVTAGWGRYLANRGPLEAPTSVIINPGEGSSSIAAKLAAAGVISHPQAFKAAVQAMGLTQTLKAGEYQFDPGISLRATINKLAIGDTENRAVTIPEGYTVAQIIRTLEGVEGLTGDPLRAPEGHLFPDTYSFRFGTEREKLMESMKTRMDEELKQAWNSRAENLPYTSPEELLTMASIVQKEAATEDEMPRIAAVFTNRLKTGMRLQADPTIIYGNETFKRGDKLTKKDITEPHPFNTYVHKGLPPTPIANPGRAALAATANPAQEEYLFFVADPARTHHVFSKTYAEHRKNVAHYWKNVGKLPASISATLVTATTPVTPTK